SFCDDALGQSSAQTFAAKLQANIQTLHFADLVLQPVECDAPSRLAIAQREQQAPLRRSIIARQFREFFVEALEAEAEVERLCVFEEEFADSGNLLRRFRLPKFKTLSRRLRRESLAFF